MDRAYSPPLPRLLTTPDDARRAAVPPGQLSVLLLAHGSMELRWYAPRGVDPQSPHDRDELYMVASGAAVFVRAEERRRMDDDVTLPLGGEERVAVQPGDVLFVPAGTMHHFEAMSADFGAWVVFYGPEGGE